MEPVKLESILYFKASMQLVDCFPILMFGFKVTP
jgi:hypothetical protein